MSDVGNFQDRVVEASKASATGSDAAMALALGLLALFVGLGATMAGAWIGYWQGPALIGLASLPEPDRISLYLVVCGSATTMLGAWSIYRSQDM